MIIFCGVCGKRDDNACFAICAFCSGMINREIWIEKSKARNAVDAMETWYRHEPQERTLEGK